MESEKRLSKRKGPMLDLGKLEKLGEDSDRPQERPERGEVIILLRAMLAVSHVREYVNL